MRDIHVKPTIEYFLPQDQGKKARRYDLQIKQTFRTISSNHMQRHYLDADSNKMKLLRDDLNTEHLITLINY